MKLDRMTRPLRHCAVEDTETYTSVSLLNRPLSLLPFLLYDFQVYPLSTFFFPHPLLCQLILSLAPSLLPSLSSNISLPCHILPRLLSLIF